ncbi:MAG: NrsF family protein [Paracoccaceae bacterium]
MKTDDLIQALANDAVVAPAPQRHLIWLMPALAFVFVALWSVLGLRADLDRMMQDPVSMMRLVLGISLGSAALWAAVLFARPGAVVRLWPISVVGLIALGLWLWAFGQAPASARQAEIIGKTLVECLTSIPLLAILPTVAVLVALRHGAAVRPVWAGAAAGLAGGGFATAIYALHCTEDNPLFYVTWYGTAILCVSAVSAVIGHKVLRW